VIDFSSTGLPLVPHLPTISETLDRQRRLVLTAEPGAGKSTLVPPYLMDEPWLAGRAIVMLEPRRLAAASVAGRMAELLDEPVGARAGYRVRTASRVSKETRIEVVTEALLTRRVQEDPLLEGVGLVILDEFHERSVHADLALAVCIEVRRARPELALLVMSATLETEPVAALLRDAQGEPAPALHCPGALYPVITRYHPSGQGNRWEEAFADGVARLFDETGGDILAFLPGAGEIRRAVARLGGALAGRAEVMPLHGTMRLEDQQRVIRPQEGRAAQGRAAARRVILATSIAETSLTVPGIRTVADCGWSRISRFHPGSGLDRLVTERVSASGADQRRGRAGRLGPGLCVRFWAEGESLPTRPDPEILRSDLSGLVLECALWGARTPENLQWLDAPSASAWTQALEILRMLGLLDDNGVTAEGKTVARLGLAPRLGVLITQGVARNERVLAAVCAALLEERDGSGISDDPDFRVRLEMIRTGRGGSDSWRRAVAMETERILRRSREAGATDYGWTVEQEERVGNLLARGFPDRIARRDPDGSFRLVTGRAVRFPGPPPRPGMRVAIPSRAAGAWVVAPDVDAGETSGIIHLAAPLDKEEAEQSMAAAARENIEVRWEGMVPRGMLVRRAGRLVLTERPVRPSADQIAGSFHQRLLQEGVPILPWNPRSRGLLQRMRFFARARPEAGLGDLSDAGLASRAAEWLEPFLKLTGGQAITAGQLMSALEGLLGKERKRLAVEAPESITLPTGSRRQIDYEGDEPAVEARIQEVFGLAESPRVCGAPLTFRLLSPARRPLQITRDLSSFWRTTYSEVRKEMRGRYPKHYWPENPLEAEPISGVRPKR
jgi:ATP-dependent helicase HrpB